MRQVGVLIVCPSAYKVKDELHLARRTLGCHMIARDVRDLILQVGLQSPILVRQDGERFVLVEGLHRLEACKQLGDETIVGYIVQARPH